MRFASVRHQPRHWPAPVRHRDLLARRSPRNNLRRVLLQCTDADFGHVLHCSTFDACRCDELRHSWERNRYMGRGNSPRSILSRSDSGVPPFCRDLPHPRPIPRTRSGTISVNNSVQIIDRTEDDSNDLLPCNHAWDQYFGLDIRWTSWQCTWASSQFRPSIRDFVGEHFAQRIHTRPQVHSVPRCSIRSAEQRVHFEHNLGLTQQHDVGTARRRAFNVKPRLQHPRVGQGECEA